MTTRLFPNSTLEIAGARFVSCQQVLLFLLFREVVKNGFCLRCSDGPLRPAGWNSSRIPWRILRDSNAHRKFPNSQIPKFQPAEMRKGNSSRLEAERIGRNRPNLEESAGATPSNRRGPFRYCDNVATIPDTCPTQFPRGSTVAPDLDSDTANFFLYLLCRLTELQLRSEHALVSVSYALVSKRDSPPDECITLEEF